MICYFVCIWLLEWFENDDNGGVGNLNDHTSQKSQKVYTYLALRNDGMCGWIAIYNCNLQFIMAWNMGVGRVICKLNCWSQRLEEEPFLQYRMRSVKALWWLLSISSYWLLVDMHCDNVDVTICVHMNWMWQASRILLLYHLLIMMIISRHVAKLNWQTVWH